MNKNLKEQAKEYYDKYKDYKHAFLRDRKTMHIRESALDLDISENLEDNMRLKVINKEIGDEFGFIKKKLGMKDKNLTPGKYLFSSIR